MRTMSPTIATSPTAPRDARPADAALALQREILAELRTIRQLLEHRGRPTTLTRADQELLGRLLPAISGALGSALFTTKELFEIDAPGVQLVTAGLTSTRIGRLFRRAEGQRVDAYLVQRAGAEAHAALWRVVRVVDP
jgi:hypothetical protein